MRTNSASRRKEGCLGALDRLQAGGVRTELLLLRKQHHLDIAIRIQVGFRGFYDHRFVDLLVVIRDQPHAGGVVTGVKTKTILSG
jgi:hypothetical protein